MFRRGEVCYSEDTVTRKQHSLRTKDEGEALTLLHAKNESRLTRRRPAVPLFLQSQGWRLNATEFASRCRLLRIKGITLHSYRYAWAERARVAGMPERFAQEALGHNSKAVHRAYAKRALVKVPSLEECKAKGAAAKSASAA